MSYMKHLALDTRTCGEADEDAQHDKRDGLTTRITTNRARWAAAHKRLDEMDKRARPLPMIGTDYHVFGEE